MKTQKEQIMEAKQAYIMQLNEPRDGMSAARFAVYLARPNGLQVLWPSDSDKGKKSAELLHCQCYTSRRTYPAYHFSLSGCGYSKTYEIAEVLKKINPDIEVYSIGGYQPSLIS